jgi:Flp pilus assembly protein TadG
MGAFFTHSSGALSRRKQQQHGTTIVEFAIVAVVFFTLMLGIMDFGRMLFTWNAAAEATRWGARIAVVCDKLSPDQVRSKMKVIMPALSNANIQINWYNPAGIVNNTCDKTTCKGVEVSVAGLTIPNISPFMGFLMPTVPPFATYLPRESMEATSAAGDSNPVCL